MGLHFVELNKTIGGMDRFRAMEVFVEAARTLSFAAAARQLNISRGMVSRHIYELEQNLGVRLFNRTTRDVSLTAAGAQHYTVCSEVIRVLAAEDLKLAEVNKGNKGILRIVSVRSFGERHLAKAVAEFHKKNPEILVHLELAPGTKTPLQLHEKGFDLGVGIAPVTSPSAVVREVTRFDWVFCASRAYLKKNGPVSDLVDLAAHPIIVNPRTFPNGICNLARAHKSYSVRLNVEISITNYWAIREVMLEDSGIALLPSFCAKEDIESGAVERILPAYLLQQGQVSAVYPHYEHIPRRAKLFTRFIQQRFARAFQMD